MSTFFRGRRITKIEYNSLNLPKQVDIKSPVAEARNEYVYSATGAKLKVIQKWNPNFSTSPIIGSTVNVSTLTASKETNYVGNKIYEKNTNGNNILKRILVDGGYIEGGKYHFFVTDHLGSNRVVADASGNAIQQNHFYPFGLSFAESTGGEKQPNKYTGMELDPMHGLALYDYISRMYDPQKGRFDGVDAHSENYYSWSPYVYVLNNPMKYIDPNGMDTVGRDNDGNEIYRFESEGPDVIYGSSQEVVVTPESQDTSPAPSEVESPSMDTRYDRIYSLDIGGSFVTFIGFQGQVSLTWIPGKGAYIIPSGGAAAGFDVGVSTTFTVKNLTRNATGLISALGEDGAIQGSPGVLTFGLIGDIQRNRDGSIKSIGDKSNGFYFGAAGKAPSFSIKSNTARTGLILWGK